MYKEYKGFSISLGTIREGKRKYVGLIARAPGRRIEAPINDRYNHKNLRKAITEFTNKN